MMSLRHAARLLGTDQAYVSRRTHARKNVKGYDLYRHALFDNHGHIAGFNIPQEVLELWKNGPKAKVNAVNVDHPVQTYSPLINPTLQNPCAESEHSSNSEEKRPVPILAITCENEPEKKVNGVNVDHRLTRVSFVDPPVSRHFGRQRRGNSSCASHG